MCGIRKIRVGYFFNAKKDVALPLLCENPHSESKIEQFELEWIHIGVDLMHAIENELIDVFVLKCTELLAGQIMKRADADQQLSVLEKFISARKPCMLVIDDIYKVRPLMNRKLMQLIIEEVAAKAESHEETDKQESHVQACSLIESHQLKQCSADTILIRKLVVACGCKEAHCFQILRAEAAIAEARTDASHVFEYVYFPFINHSALLYKVYVIDRQHSIVIKPSIKDFSSSLAMGHQSVLAEFDSQAIRPELCKFNSEMESERGINNIPIAVHQAAKKLTPIFSECLGLALFGYDLIQCSVTGNIYIIDINYFPSYSNMEKFQERFGMLIVKRFCDHQTRLHTVSSMS